LNKERDSKRRLEEANRIIREQANQQTVAKTLVVSAAAGPGLLMPDTVIEQTGEPAMKRLRVESASIPPPPPPIVGAGMFSQEQVHGASSGFDEQPVDEQPPDTPGAMNETESAEKKVLSEADFVASLSKPEVMLQIRIPNDPSQMAWNFYGQILSMTVDAMSKVKEVKRDLSRTHLNAMPANKIQFKDTKTGFLKDNMTLASLNIGPTATLELIPRTRAGRK
jgi:hypothetical protein